MQRTWSRQQLVVFLFSISSSRSTESLVMFGLWTITLVCVLSSAICARHHFNRTVVQELEQLGDLYYEAQKDERSFKIAVDFKRIAPNYPCVLGVVPVGLSSPESVSDGHKFTCGIHAIERQPIVYSFGSHQQQDFELAFLRLRPDAEIHIFEIDPTQLPAMQLRHESIRYNAVGLGYVNSTDGFAVKSLKDIMEQNNHKYIDVLKMDVEGHEFNFLKTEGSYVLPRVGQFLVELHVHTTFAQQNYPGQDAYTFLVEAEKYGLRLFHQEVNVHAPLWGTELSMIQSKWIVWDETKHLIS